MSINYELDYKISIETEIEYSSLYNWCIRERDEHGKQVGRDLIPFIWNNYFHARNFKITRRVSSQSGYERVSADGTLSPIRFSGSDFIIADLDAGTYDEDDWQKTSYAMMGSSRSINKITLRIERCESIDDESCFLWGEVAHDMEIDFRNRRTEDSLWIQFCIAGEKFDNLFHLISRNEINQLTLSLMNVDGFYSDWSPGISTDHIKILANAGDQKLEIPSEYKDRVRSLASAREASIWVQRERRAKIAARQEMDKSELWEDAEQTTTEPTLELIKPSSEDKYEFIERSLTRISKLLGLVIIIELLKLILR